MHLTNHASWKYSAFVAAALFSACSDVAPSNETPAGETADAGPRLLPTLPPDCDVLPSSISTGAGSSAELAHLSKRIRAVGDTVYFHRTGGIHAVKMPSGSPTLSTQYPTVTLSDGHEAQWEFRDFWIDETSLIGTAAGVLYGGPAAGGPVTLMPGYEAPSQGASSTGFYARAGDNVYRATFLSPTGYGIERLSLTGAKRSEFLRLNIRYLERIVAGVDSLYYVDKEGDAHAETVFAAALDTGASVPIARGLRYPYLVGFDGSLYVADVSTPSGQLFRIHADHTLEKLTIPYYVALPMEISFTTFRGVNYFTASAGYYLPDDRRVELRDVVMQIRSEASGAEVVRCLPNPPTNPTTPTSSRTARVIDLAAGESAVYLARTLLDERNSTWEDQILAVAP